MRPGRFELPIFCRTFFLARRLPCKFVFKTLELNNGPCAGPGYGKLATSQHPNVPTRSRTWVVAATARRPNHKTIRTLHPVADFVHFFFLDESLDSFDKQQQPWCRARIDGVGLHAKTSEQIRVVGTHRWRSPRLGRTKILLLLPAASSFKVTLTHHIRLLI